jgi:formate-dependent nitrite reductase membrane component NrfD
MILVATKYGRTTPALAALQRIDIWVVVLELIVLIALIISLGPVARAWLNAWGALLLIGVIGVGMVLPLVLYWRGGKTGVHNLTTAAALVLVGGFLLRLVIVFSAQRL